MVVDRLGASDSVISFVSSHELMELVEASLKRADEAMTKPADGKLKMSQTLAEDILQFVQEARTVSYLRGPGWYVVPLSKLCVFDFCPYTIV